jgi:uncharacterized membrane protein
MRLSETGESRVRGYVFVLDRSLRSFLPRDVASDAAREVESHIRDRVDQIEAVPDERSAVERILAELGPPLRVAQAYSHEMTLDEAVTTGRFVPVMRAVWHAATTSVVGFLWAWFVLTGWVLGLAFFLVAVIKIVFPNNVGLFLLNGAFYAWGAMIDLPPGIEARPIGYWAVPVFLALGFGILVGTQRASRRILSWMRSRKRPVRIAVRVEMREP